MSQHLIDALNKAKKFIKEQQDYIEALFNHSSTVGVVTSFSDLEIEDEDGNKKSIKSAIVSFHGDSKEIALNKKVPVKIGTAVKTISTQQGTGILGVIDSPSFSNQEMCKVLEVDHTKKRVLVSKNGDSRVVNADSSILQKLDKGDTVVVVNNLVITELYEKRKIDNTLDKAPDITWEDIGGLEEAKKALKEVVETPVSYGKLYKAYRKKAPKGVLLYGPPGNGKTLLGKAVANALAEIHKKDLNGFFYIKGPEVLSMYVGMAEQKIRSIFSDARDFYEKHGFPGVVFIDEAESLLYKRGSGKSSDVDRTIVPQFLTEMDGITDSNVFVILATNRPDMLDEAIIREGRIDKKIRIDSPCVDSAKQILYIHSKEVPFKENKESILDSFIRKLYSENFPLYSIETSEGEKIVHLSNIVNGAMLSVFIQNAINNALNEDIAKGNKNPTGVSEEHLLESLYDLYKQHLGVNHDDYIRHHTEILKEKNLKIQGIKKLKNADIQGEKAVAA